MGGPEWMLVVVGGPILLAAAFIWALLNNRRRSAAQKARTEDATRELYRQEDRADKEREAPRS